MLLGFGVHLSVFVRQITPVIDEVAIQQTCVHSQWDSLCHGWRGDDGAEDFAGLKSGGDGGLETCAWVCGRVCDRQRCSAPSAHNPCAQSSAEA